MTHLTLNLTIDEANLILESLGELPFSRVYEIIGKIQQQARTQVDQQRNASPARSGNQIVTDSHDQAETSASLSIVDSATSGGAHGQ